MVSPEEIDAMKFPPLVVFLLALQEEGLSFDWSYKDGMIHSIPVPGEHLADKIQRFYEELRALQPGYCDECLEWWPRRFQSYWSSRPLFCPPCWKSRIRRYQLSGQWPQAELPE